MILLEQDSLTFMYPDVHPKARLSIEFQRTLRIPDDGSDYPLPPGLGRFPLRHVDDFTENLPHKILNYGGVMMPMYQSEALWLQFSGNYPFVVKVATGKMNAVTGEPWVEGIHRDPQDYLVSPDQPWLDGYCIEKGIIRQFVAMPLGAGYSVEEQLTDEAEYGGIQIAAYPMKKEAYKEHFMIREEGVKYCSLSLEMKDEAKDSGWMGLSPGGRMKQEIYDDPYEMDEWDLRSGGRCFVHLANSMVWRQLTGQAPPTVPFTSKEYNKAGFPWFDYYSENAESLDGGNTLKKLKTVKEMGADKGQVPLPENESVSIQRIVDLRKNLGPGQIREPMA